MSDSTPAGAALVDRSDEGRLLLTGEQSLWFVDQLFTNSFEDLGDGRVLESLLLTPKGRITAHLTFLHAGGDLLAVVTNQPAARVAASLRDRVFSTRVEIEDVTESTALLMVVGIRAADAIAEVHPAIALPVDPGAVVREGNVWIASVTDPAPGYLVCLDREGLEPEVAALQKAGATVSGPDDLDVLRTVAGRPRFGVDFDGAHLPQQAAMERAVHFDKGCYLGQEAVAMAQRGRVSRRLRHLRFEDGPATGEARLEGEPVGEVTSAASVSDGGWGIGMISTSVEVGSSVRVSGRDAVVGLLPGEVEGPKTPSARELRERLEGPKEGRE